MSSVTGICVNVCWKTVAVTLEIDRHKAVNIPWGRWRDWIRFNGILQSELD